MKVYGPDGIAPLILNLNTRGDEWPVSRLDGFNPEEIFPGVH